MRINSEMRKGVASNDMIEKANLVILQITESKGDHFINLFPLFFNGEGLNDIYITSNYLINVLLFLPW